MRILALDWGTVRIGAAITDEEERIAFPLDKPLDAADSISAIKQIVVEQGVGKILLGLPLNLEGQASDSAERARSYARQINQETGLSVEMIDERFSSAAAGKILDQQGMDEKKQRQIKDNIAAQQLLQQYLDSKNNQKN